MKSTTAMGPGLAIATAFSLSLTLLFGGTTAGPAIAHSAGPLPSYTGAPGDSDCTLCHTGNALNSGVATATIVAPTVVTPSAAHTVVVSLTNGVNPNKNGFQVTARNGLGVFTGSWVATMVPPLFSSPRTTTHPSNAAYHEHTSTGNALSSWTMDWVAPASLPPGPVTFYAALNDANGDSSASGDFIFRRSTKMFQASLTSVSSLWNLGSVNHVAFSAPGHAGEFYGVIVSEDPTPVSVGGPFELQANFLTGLAVYALGAPEYFLNLTGLLSAGAGATIFVYVPPLPALVGLQLHFAGATVSTSTMAIDEVTNRLTVTFQ